MPINVIVTNSGKILQQENVINIFEFTLAASGFTQVPHRSQVTQKTE